MKRRLILSLLALGILSLAVAGWVVQSLRWALTLPLRPRTSAAASPGTLAIAAGDGV